MKNAMHDILLFGAGFAAGAYFMHTVMRRAYDEKYRKEVQDLKAHWEKREANLDEEVEKKANQKGFELAMGPYRTESDPEDIRKPEQAIEIIEPDEFGADENYETSFLSFYADGKLKKSANKAIGTVADFITGQSKNLNGYKDVLTSLPAIVGAAVSAFAEEFKGAAGNVESATSRVYEPVKAFFKALKDGFDSISGTDIYRFLSLLDVGLLSYAIAQFAKAMNSLRKMLATPLSKMLDSISGSFNALTGALKTWQKQENTKILTGIGSALLMLAGAMFVMSRIDPERFVCVRPSSMPRRTSRLLWWLW